MNAKVVPMPGPDLGAVEYAEGLLARCRSGETVGVTAVEEKPGGLYTLHGSKTLSRLQTAGALLDAAVWRLGA